MKKLLGIDLEMLCNREPRLSFTKMETIRIGAALYDPSTQKTRFFDEYVQPMKNKTLSSFCKSLTGITQEAIDQADHFPLVMERFLKWVGSLEDVLIISWGLNDIKRLRMDYNQHRMKLDDLLLMENAYENFQGTFRQVAGGDRSVEYALNLYEERFVGEKHNPKYDAYNLIRIYLNHQKRKHFNELLKVKELPILFSEGVLQKGKNLANKLDYNEHIPCDSSISCFQKQVANEILGYAIKEIKSLQTELRTIDSIKIRYKKIRKIRKKYRKLSEQRSIFLKKVNIAEPQRILDWMFYLAYAEYRKVIEKENYIKNKDVITA